MDHKIFFEPSCQGMIPFPRYHDFSTKDQAWVEKQLAYYQDNGLLPKQPRRRTKSTFPENLYYMLESVESAGKSNIVSFQPHGRSFKIYDRKLFASDVLPHYFPHQTKIASFLRQLNIYGFLRMIKCGPDQESYYHQFFLHGRPEMCCLIQRNPIALRCARQTYNPSTEPDFYRMFPVKVTNTKPSSSCNEKIIDPERTTGINNNDPCKTDPNQSIGDLITIASATTNEYNHQTKPSQHHYGNWDIEPLPLMDALSGIRSFAIDSDLNYHPFYLRRQPELSSNLNRNSIAYSFPSQGPQSMVETVPMQLSNDVIETNIVNMNCEDPQKMQSLLGMTNRTQPKFKHINEIKVTRPIEEMSLLDTFSVGATSAPNVQNHFNVDMMSNSAEILSSIRIFDENFAHEQHDCTVSTSQSLDDIDESSRTSGSGMVQFLDDVDLESD